MSWKPWVVVLLAAGCLQAQTAVSVPVAFEVASVRLSAPNHGFAEFSPAGARQFTVKNMPLRILISIAYGVDSMWILDMPGSSGDEAYDISARPEGETALSKEQLESALQRLLAERLHLKVHPVEREVAGYALTVAKGGPKLIPTKGAAGPNQIAANEMRGTNINVKTLAGFLSASTGAPVADKTGIAGNYDVKLSYASGESVDESLPSIFTAVQEQLGLKLERAKVPVTMLEVDHVDRVPTEN